VTEKEGRKGNRPFAKGEQPSTASRRREKDRSIRCTYSKRRKKGEYGERGVCSGGIKSSQKGQNSQDYVGSGGTRS